MKIILYFFVIVILVVRGNAWAGNADYITASGCSVSNIGYLLDIAREYEKRTGVKIFVRGGGSVVGIEDLRTGKVDFAASCRDREEDDPKEIEFIQVAWDALAFIAHRSNPVENISLENAKAIYHAQLTNWKQLKGQDMPIKIFISRPRKGLSGVEASTRKLVLQGTDPVASQNTFFVASTAIVEQMVEDTPEGFATTGFTSARKRDVKMLKVNGVYPTGKNIVSKRYPLKRPLFLLVPKNTRSEVRKFIDFVLSREGQEFLRSLGVVSLVDVK